jgi:hypothetical protein
LRISFDTFIELFNGSREATFLKKLVSSLFMLLGLYGVKI